MTERACRVAMLSVHSSPLGKLGTRDTGGMSVYVLGLSRALGERGVAVDLFTRREDPADEPVVQVTPEVRLVRLQAGPPAPLDKDEQPAVAGDFRRAFEDFQHRDRGAYALLHAHYWISGLVGLALRETLDVPLILTFHTLAALKLRQPRAAAEAALRLQMEARLATAADRLLVATPAERRELTSLHEVPECHIGIVPGGVDTCLFRPHDRRQARRELGLPDHARIFLAVGRPAPVKGFPLLLEAFAEHRQRATDRLLLIGEQPNNADPTGNLREVAERLGLSGSVLFPGRVDQQRMAQWYSAADCVVVPSYLESFGLVALEALACGTPVIAAATGGMVDYVEHGRNGFLFAPGNRDELSERLRQFAPEAFQPQALRDSVATWTWAAAADRLMTEYARAEAAHRHQGSSSNDSCQQALHLMEASGEQSHPSRPRPGHRPPS